MARPRVFVSSTYYDLKFLRSSLEVFIESLGFEPVLFEKGDVAFSPIRALDQSCYKEAQNCDLFVLIIGGRYGSPTSSEGEVRDIKVDPYVSITKKEFETANKKGVPCFVLIESGVYSEFQTYKKNKNKEISFAHVDSKNVYIFIDEILSLKINNPVFSFNHTQEIYDWLREQWCGIFKDLLQNSTSDSKIKDLQTEIKNLNQVTNSLKEYLEVIIEKVDSSNAKKIIRDENKKISKEKMINKLLENDYFNFISMSLGGGINNSEGHIANTIENVKSIDTKEKFFSFCTQHYNDISKSEIKAGFLDFLNSMNECRKILNLPIVENN